MLVRQYIRNKPSNLVLHLKKMQTNETERTQSFAMTQNSAVKRKMNDGTELVLSKYTAHGCSEKNEDSEKRAANSAVKTLQSHFVTQSAAISPPTKHTRICKIESLFCRSHSIDDSAIRTMSEEKKPKTTIINDRYRIYILSKIHKMNYIYFSN